MKFIVSSKALWILMEKERSYELADGEVYTLKVENGKLHFNGISQLEVEAKEGGEVSLSKNQFKRLRKVVRALEEQPIVLYVASHQLQIQNCCF